jgi:hypothetical protein
MKKNLSLLAIILVALVAIIVIANQLQNKKPSEKSLVLLSDFSEATCSEIVVTESNQTARLMRKAANWVVEGTQSAAAAAPVSASPIAKPAPSADLNKSDDYPADSALIQTAIEKIKSLNKEDLISQNPQKQADLEVDSAKAVFVEVFGDKGKSAGAFYVGKNGANWDQNFVREKGSNDVYLVGGSVRTAFFGDSKRWKDKTIVKFDKTFVKKIQIAKKDSGTIELTHITASPTDTSVKEGWILSGPEKVKIKKDKVEDALNTMSRLQAADFETNTALSADSMGFSKPELVITATLQNGETKSVIFGKKKTPVNQYWAKTPDNTKAIFLAYDYNVTSMGQTLNGLKDIPEVKKDAPQVAAAKPGASPKHGAKSKTKPEKLVPVNIH